MIVFFFIPLFYPAQAADSELESALNSLRKVTVSEMNSSDMMKKSVEIEKSWDVIKSRGESGVRRIKEELDSIDRSGENDDFFKLNVSMLLWKISGKKESATIAKIWNSADLSRNYKYPFFTAIDAAATGDPEVAMMLLPFLGEKKAELKLDQIGMVIRWPQTAEYIWGVYGRSGSYHLDKILNSAEQGHAVAAAIIISTKNQSISSLPAIRRIAIKSRGEQRYTAIKSLGIYGHPDDFEFLISGLSSDDPEARYSHLWALYEYDDIRAVPYIIPLLSSESGDTVKEAVSCLSSMITFESFEALVDFNQRTKNREMKIFSQRYIDPLLDKKISIEAYRRLSADERRRFVSAVEKQRAGRYVLGKDEIKISRNDFLSMAASWKKESRVYSSVKGFSERHILSVAGPHDIDMLIDLKSRIYSRNTFDVSREIDFLDAIIKLLSRKRYRP